MNVDGKHYRTIWLKDEKTVQIIDQRWLPHKFIIEDLKAVDDFCVSIKDMHVRGAGLIGATAGYGMYIASLEAPEDSFDEFMVKSAERLKATRPTAVNLAWACRRQLTQISKGKSVDEKIAIAKRTSQEIADEDADFCRRIGEHGVKIIEELSRKKKPSTY